MRFLGGAALVAASMLLLTGCGSQATPSSATPSISVAPSTSAPPAPAPTATPTVTVTAPATSKPTPPATTSADPNRPRNQCATSDLGFRIAVADGGGAAGSEHYNVLLTNTGGTPCALRGTPGVSVVGGGNGTQLGAAAARNEQNVTTYTLQVGQTVAAPLQIVNIGTDGGPLDGCTVVKGDGYRVYPPHSTTSRFVPDSKAVACSPGPSFMTVGPVVPSTD